MNNPELIAHLAELSKIEFSEEEFRKIAIDIENIIELMDKVKLSPACASVHPTPIDFDSLRPDSAKPSATAEEILQNSKSTSGVCFTVPRII